MRRLVSKWLSFASITLAPALAAPACSDDAGDPGIDPVDATFAEDGKADSAISEGSPIALGVLRVANESVRDVLAKSSGVGLGTRTSDAILKVRNGKDKKAGTTDDVVFATLQQLDAVPYVGPAALNKLVAYAEKAGFVPAAPAGVVTAETARKPWSGYWWSMQNGELALGWTSASGRKTWSEADVRAFDACLDSISSGCTSLMKDHLADQGRRLSPLMKFDLWVRRWLEAQNGIGGTASTMFTHATRWELDHHYIGDNPDHPHAGSAGYAGKCIGWALANMDWDEPASEKTLLGVTFEPADIKGILAAIYNGAQFFVPDDQWLGNAYHEREGSDTSAYYEDVRPDDFVRALLATIGQGKMLEGDLDPGDGVWNYPIYKYELRPGSAKDQKVAVAATIAYANDEVAIDEVFSTDPARPDLLSRDLTFELDVPTGWSGDLAAATGGRWTGASVDTHPDALILGLEPNWRTDIHDYKNTQMNQEVNFPLIKRLKIGRSWTPIVDQLLADYYRK
jgi:hypothetical protein